MDSPIRPIRYKVYRDPTYDPANAEARVLLEEIERLRAELVSCRAVLSRYEEELREIARSDERPVVSVFQLRVIARAALEAHR